MKTGSFINGKWVMPENASRNVVNRNPANPDEVIAEFPCAGEKETLEAIAVAEAAYKEWRNVSACERGRYVWKVVELAKQRTDEIAEIMTREEGKILPEAKGEVKKGINILEYYAGAGFRFDGKTSPAESSTCATYTIRRPLGVVGIITPWNFPWAIPCWKIAPALVAGNTVVFKPAELTPGTASLLVELFEEAGLPAGVLNMVVGPGSKVGQTIVEHPSIKAVSFTGSNSVGQKLITEAASGLKKITCEMGGKNALIVMPDADIDAAVTATGAGAFGSTGQRCTATSRLLVHKDIKDEFMQKLIAEAKKYVPGDGLKGATMGPSVDENQFNTVLEYIEIGKSEGANLVLGGNRVGDKGYFVEPTIFDGVKPEMRIFQEEIFGPVLSVVEFSTLQEAFELANNCQYGLAGSIFTKDVFNAMEYIENIEVGMVHINEPTIGGEAQLPFGGLKATGYGDREMAEDGINFFSETKTVFINYSGSGDRQMIR